MRYAIGIFLLVLTAAARAAPPFCVDTPQKLRDAFVAAQNSGLNNVIKIVRGTYNTSGTRFSYDTSNSSTDGNLIVRGGFNADCTTQIANAALTVLDGGGASGVLSVAAKSGSVTVEYLTIQNAEDVSSGNLALSVGSVTGNATASFNVVRNSHVNSVLGAALSVAAGGTIHVDNNLVYGNSISDGAGSVEILSAGGDAFATNNTVAGNTNTSASQPVGGVYFSYFFISTTPSAYFSNNIFYSNTNYGLYVNSGALAHTHLANNDIGNTNVDTTCCGNVDVVPQFVDKVGGNFRLSPTSPVLEVGTTTPMGGLPQIDLAGNPRFYNGLVDLGAYERGNVIFTDGFDH